METREKGKGIMQTTMNLDKAFFALSDFDEKQQAAVLAQSTEPNETGCRFWSGRFAADNTPIVMLFRSNETAIFVPVARLWGAVNLPDWIDETAYTSCGDYCCVAPEHGRLNEPPKNITKRAKIRYKCGVESHDPLNVSPSGACRDCHDARRAQIMRVASGLGMTSNQYRETYRTAKKILDLLEVSLQDGGPEVAKITADNIARK